jgi:hypothetical protein
MMGQLRFPLNLLVSDLLRGANGNGIGEREEGVLAGYHLLVWLCVLALFPRIKHKVGEMRYELCKRNTKNRRTHHDYVHICSLLLNRQ